MTKLLQVIGVLAVGGLVTGACSSSGGNQTGTGGTTGQSGCSCRTVASHGGASGRALWLALALAAGAVRRRARRR